RAAEIVLDRVDVDTCGPHDVERDRDDFGTDAVAADHCESMGHVLLPLTTSEMAMKKPPTLAWTVASERRGGVRLRNNEDGRVDGRPESHRTTRIAPDTVHVKPCAATRAVSRGYGAARWVPCPVMAASHLSPQAYERLQDELAWR